MKRDEILLRLQKNLSQILGEDESMITEEASFSHDLGADSLHMLEICIDTEKDFGIKIYDVDRERIEKVSDLVSYVENVTSGN